MPTIRELGYDYTFDSPYGVAGPKDLAPGIVKKLHERLMHGEKLSAEEQSTLTSATSYWHQRTAHERLAAVEKLRQMIWGYDDTLRIEKVFQIVSDDDEQK